MYSVYKVSKLSYESYQTKEDPLPRMMLEGFSGWAQYNDEEIDVSVRLENGVLMEFSVQSLQEGLNDKNLAYYINTCSN